MFKDTDNITLNIIKAGPLQTLPLRDSSSHIQTKLFHTRMAANLIRI